jgi:hypothetical protein
MRGEFCIAFEAASVQLPHATIAATAGNQRLVIDLQRDGSAGGQPGCHSSFTLRLEQRDQLEAWSSFCRLDRRSDEMRRTCRRGVCLLTKT